MFCELNQANQATLHFLQISCDFGSHFQQLLELSTTKDSERETLTMPNKVTMNPLLNQYVKCIYILNNIIHPFLQTSTWIFAAPFIIVNVWKTNVRLRQSGNCRFSCLLLKRFRSSFSKHSLIASHLKQGWIQDYPSEGWQGYLGKEGANIRFC